MAANFERKPDYYWHLSQAVYTDVPQDYLDQQRLNSEVLAEKTIKGLKVIVIKDTVSGGHTAAFRGTWNCANVFDDILHIMGCSRLVPLVQKFIATCEEQIGEIGSYTGHSLGGYIASRATSKKVKRIVTFNAHQSVVGERVFNFRTDRDPLSRGEASMNYILIGKGCHSLNDFDPNILKFVNWEDARELNKLRLKTLSGKDTLFSRQGRIRNFS